MKNAKVPRDFPKSKKFFHICNKKVRHKSTFYDTLRHRDIESVDNRSEDRGNRLSETFLRGKKKEEIYHGGDEYPGGR